MTALPGGASVDEMTVAGIGHVGITVRDLERTVDFYTRFVGLRLTETLVYSEQEVGHGGEATAGAFVRCDSAHHCLAFFAVRHPPGETGRTVYGLHHLAFEMRTRQELLEKYREFRHEGLDLVNARRGGPGNQPRFYARDPDGNLLEFYWGMDSVSRDGRPRAHSAIAEIDLEQFDFEAFEREQQSAAVLHDEYRPAP